MLTLLLTACILWDTGPAERRIEALTDQDADGVTPTDGDCNDVDPSIHPGAVEACNGRDDDCDREIDEDGGPTRWCLDEDGDGHGDPSTYRNDCATPTTAVTVCDDCDDRDAQVLPGAAEVCDGQDNDCDGDVDPPDAEDAPTWYRDGDGDGWGRDGDTTRSCTVPDGYVSDAGDCDDASAEIFPDAPETCNDGVDSDCDGATNACGLYGTLSVGPGVVGSSEGGHISSDVSSAYLGTTMMVGDLFGDGTGDILLGAIQTSSGGSSDAGSLELWTSPPRGDAYDPPSVVVAGLDDLYLTLGETPGLLADLDGDGWPTLLIGASGRADGFPSGGALLDFDPATLRSRVVVPDDVRIGSDSPDAGFGYTIRSSLTLGETAPSLIVTAPYESSRFGFGGVIYVLPEAALSPADCTATIWGSKKDVHLGIETPMPSDLNGDGVDDLVTGHPYEADGPGVSVFAGPLVGEYTSDDADATYTSPGETYPGQEVTLVAGDAGVPLLAVSSGGPDGAYEGALYIVPGGLTGAMELAEVATATLLGPDGGRERASALQGGDVNGDRSEDLLVGAFAHEADGVSEAGAVYVYYGPFTFTGTDTYANRADFILEGREENARVGTQLATGDVNNDAHHDILAFGQVSPANEHQAGGAWLLYGEGI